MLSARTDRVETFYYILTSPACKGPEAHHPNAGVLPGLPSVLLAKECPLHTAEVGGLSWRRTSDCRIAAGFGAVDAHSARTGGDDESRGG